MTVLIVLIYCVLTLFILTQFNYYMIKLYVIPYVSKCLHLGTTIYTTLYRDNVIDVVNELYKRTDYLLSDFSFTESCTVSK